jgi:hypothetical protein
MSLITPVFAADASYPAGAEAWSAQPTKVSPLDIEAGFTPDTPATAETNNYLLNRIETAHNNLYNVIGAPLATLAVLTAIAAPADGTVRHVLGFGLYVFKTSATTGLSPFRLAADDATTGGWLSSTAHQTTLTRQVPGNEFTWITPTAIAPTVDVQGLKPITGTDTELWGAQGLTILAASTHATDTWGYLAPIDKYLVHGATLASATLRWTPDDSTTPTVGPQIAVIRTAHTGLALTSDNLRSGGFVIDSGGTWSTGVDRNIVFTADQNNVIDLDTYSYAVLYFDQHGATSSAGNVIHRTTLSMTGIPDARR